MATNRSTRTLLENTPVRSLVLQLGIPAMFGQLFNILYSIVDRIYVGQIPEVGETALASIGICAPALTAISAFAYMVGIGGASSMSIYMGQKDEKQAKAILGNAVFLLFSISIVVTGLLLITRKPLLYLLGCSDAMYPYAEAYFTIYILGTVASLLGVGLNQFVLAQGFAREGMIAVALGAVINVVLDPLLIFAAGMGISGASCDSDLSMLHGRLCCVLPLPRKSTGAVSFLSTAKTVMLEDSFSGFHVLSDYDSG